MSSISAGARWLCFGSQTIKEVSCPGPPGFPIVPNPELGPGETLTLFLDVILPRGRKTPSELAHRFVFRLQRDTRQAHRVHVVGARTTVERRTAISVSPPLRGDKLLGVIAHTPQTIDNRLSHAQRYKCDLLRSPQPSGRQLLRWLSAPQRELRHLRRQIFAAAAGTIVAIRNDMAENTPPTEPPFTTYDDVAGNRVVRQLGGDRYALYAHMQPGSVRVNVGQRVERGRSSACSATRAAPPRRTCTSKSWTARAAHPP